MYKFSLLTRVVYNSVRRRERRMRKCCDIYKKIIIFGGQIDDFYMGFEIFGGAEGAAEIFGLHEEKSGIIFCTYFFLNLRIKLEVSHLLPPIF